MSGIDFLGYAYTAVWVGFFFFLLSLSRRATRLEEEIRELKE